jgi:hypothetical protein
MVTETLTRAQERAQNFREWRNTEGRYAGPRQWREAAADLALGALVDGDPAEAQVWAILAAVFGDEGKAS